MKKVFFSLLCILLTLMLVSCDLLGGSLSEYITEYTQNAALEMAVIPTSFPRDASQTSCINSDEAILIYLRNPQKYEIEFEYLFNESSIQTAYDNYFKDEDPIRYESITDDNSGFKMIFPSKFLEAIDMGEYPETEVKTKDISGNLYAYEKATKRSFGEVSISLHADTPPSAITYCLMQLDQDPTGEKASQARYIVCFELPHSPRNNDFAKIQINNDTWSIAYDAYRDTIQNSIKLSPYGGNRGTLIANPMLSDDPDNPGEPAPTTYPVEAGADEFTPTDPYEYDVFYYITNDLRSDRETLYKITITDKAGLTTERTVSNKAEKLTEPTFSITATPAWQDTYTTYIAGLSNTMSVTLKAANTTTRGEAAANTYCEYKVEVVDQNNNLLEPNDEWKPADNITTISGLSPNATDKYYRITARTKGRGYLQSEEKQIVFQVIRSNHFFVGDALSDIPEGTLSAPYHSFENCMLDIVSYQGKVNDLHPELAQTFPFYIDVLDDYEASSDVFDENYLINNSSATFTGTLTIQGVDSNGNPLNGKSKRTIDGGTGGSFISWTGNNQTLTVRDLTLQKFNSSSHGGCISIYMTQKQNSIVTIERCDITNNKTNTTGSQGGGIWIQGGGGTNTRVTVKDCNITYNTATMGAGVHITYGGPDPSDELYVIDGNTTISNNTADGDGGGLFICNKVEIASPNVKIIDNTSGQGGRGAGVYFSGGSLSLKGGTITGNKVKGDSEIPSNLYIVSGKTLSVTGDLSGSKIGITTATTWDEGDALIPFATYSTKPKDDVFFSDAGYPVTLGTSEASIGETGTASAGIYVNSSTGNDETGTGKKSKPYKTLAKAVEMVSEGGAILLARDQTFCTGNMETITISKNLTIGAYGEGNRPALDSTRLKIESDPEVRINNIAFKMTAVTGTSSGAFIYNDNAKVTCFGCTFTGGKATVGDYAYGGAIYNDGILLLESCSFNGNEATSEYGSGGAICGLSGYAELINCTFNDNVSKLNGAIWMMDLVLKDCSFSGNKTSAGILKAGSFIHSLTLQGTNTFQDSELFEMSPLTELPSITIGEEASLDGIDRIPLSWLQGQNTLDFEGINIFADDYSKSKAAEFFTIDDSMGSYVINNGTICKSGISGQVSVTTLYSDITIGYSTSDGIITFTGLDDVDDTIQYEIWYHGSDVDTGSLTNSNGTCTLDMNSYEWPGLYQIVLGFTQGGSLYSASFDFVKE